MKRAASYLGEVEAWVIVAVPWQPHHKFFAINRQIQILIISFKEKKKGKRHFYMVATGGFSVVSPNIKMDDEPSSV